MSTAFPDSNVHGANVGPTWVLSAPDGSHVGPMNLAIRVDLATAVTQWGMSCYELLMGLKIVFSIGHCGTLGDRALMGSL